MCKVFGQIIEIGGADVLSYGDMLVFFRIVEIQLGQMIRLKAEMKIPGEGRLKFEVTLHGEIRAKLSQTVLFAPKGLSGIVYWYLLCLLHGRIFDKMIKRLAKRSEQI